MGAPTQVDIHELEHDAYGVPVAIELRGPYMGGECGITCTRCVYAGDRRAFGEWRIDEDDDPQGLFEKYPRLLEQTTLDALVSVFAECLGCGHADISPGGKVHRKLSTDGTDDPIKVGRTTPDIDL